MLKSTVITLSFCCTLIFLCLCACDSEPTTQLPPRSQLSSLHKAHSLRRKKRRNMLAIFGFRKNRNQSASHQGPEAEAEVYGDGGHAVATPPTGFVIAGMKKKNFVWLTECISEASNRKGTCLFCHQVPFQHFRLSIGSFSSLRAPRRRRQISLLIHLVDLLVEEMANSCQCAAVVCVQAQMPTTAGGSRSQPSD